MASSVISLARYSRVAPLRPPQLTGRLLSSGPFFRRNAPWQTMMRQAYSDMVSPSVDTPEHLSEGERKVFDMIKQELEPTELEVQDISGGCGSMYALHITSSHFKGLPVIKQHRLVNKVLGDEIKKWHGIQLRTQAP